MNLLKRSLIAPSLAMILCSGLYANETYSLETMDLKGAIETISKKANIPYMVDSNLLKGKSSQKIDNISGVKNALDKVLENSGLEATIIDGTIIIKKSSKENKTSNTLEGVLIYGEPEKTTTATKLDMTIIETPQIVSVISRSQIDDFTLNDINSILDYIPGVTVERVETDRTYYTSRGFDVVNFQFDGVGVPFSYGLSQGHEDSVIYEQVEVVKGATGLITSLSNPSATINYVRKRPTKETQGYISATAGSWNQKRVEADVSGTLIEDKLTGRLVVAKQDGDSYLDRYSREITTFYGILSSDLTDTTKLSVGHSINDNHNDGMSSGALPLFYSNGSSTNYDVSSNTAPDWAYQDVKQTRTFAELEQELGVNWTAKAIYTHSVQDKEWESFYLSGNPDATTNDGLVGVASRYEAKDKQDSIDLFLTGSFSAWGQDHELVVGMNKADVKLTGRSIYSSQWSGYDDSVGTNWLSGNTARPDFDIYDESTQSTDIDQEFTSYYISSRIKASDKLSFLLGARAIDIKQSGISYGASQDATVDETVPYLGVTYEVLDGTMLYSSYSKVFNAQTWVDENLNPLGAVKGDSQEFGIKQEINDGRAILTLAYFQSKQENFGEWVGRDTTSGLNTYRGVKYKSKGFEIELAGEIIDGLNISVGYTGLKIEDENGDDARTFIPTKQFKLATAYELPNIPNLRIGGGLNWQNEIYYAGSEVQGSYALVDLFAKYNITSDISLSVNINNVTDKKYKESPQWGQAIYGAPRNASISLKYTF